MEDKIKEYTKEQVVEMIERAFWDGVEQGGCDYAGECFSAEDYLLENKD